jgi:hypothetical protein
MKSNRLILGGIALVFATTACGKKDPSVTTAEDFLAGYSMAEQHPWLEGTWADPYYQEAYHFDGRANRYSKMKRYGLNASDTGRYVACDFVIAGPFRVEALTDSERESHQGDRSAQWKVLMREESYAPFGASQDDAVCRNYAASHAASPGATLWGDDTVYLTQVSNTEFKEAGRSKFTKEIPPKSEAKLTYRIQRWGYSSSTRPTWDLTFPHRNANDVFLPRYRFALTTQELLTQLLLTRFKAPEGIAERLVEGQSSCAAPFEFQLERYDFLNQPTVADPEIKSALKTRFVPCLQQILYQLSFATEGTLAREINTLLTQVRDTIIDQ